MKQDIHILIPKEKYQLIKELAEKDNRKITAIIEMALDNYLKARKVDAYGKSKK